MQQEGAESNWTFEVGENGATQYSLDQLCGLEEPDDWRSKATFDPMTSAAKQTIPSAFDWRTTTGCPPIRNQGGCGSCWAFATVGALECAIKIREGVSVDLSEQWLVSCNTSSWGCDGGWYAHPYHGWLNDPCGGTGAVLESDFPYRADDGPCGCPYNHPYVLHNWAYIGSSSGVPSVEAMKLAILEYGPISVSVHVNNAFQGYRSGVFNSCTDGEINHSVVLVGWDDTQGDDGIWILRNSWGTWWGESGYMRIAYKCCQVGYAACYVDYRPVLVSCENDFGPAPLETSFSAGVPDATVLDYNWDFGDGNTSSDPAPVHEYDQPGCYTVRLDVNTSDGPRTRICPDFVSAHADTIRGEIIEVTEGGVLRMDVYGRNTIPVNYITMPFCWAGDFNLEYDSVTNVGCRTEYMGPPVRISYDPNNDRLAMILDAEGVAPLPPGEGMLASIWFTAPPTVSGMNPIDFLTYSRYAPSFIQADREYYPTTVDGLFHTGLAATCCVGKVGDVNGSGDDTPTIGDVSYLIDHLFVSEVPLGCLEEADINQSGGYLPALSDITIGDVSNLIDHLFISEQPLKDCF
jgi:PKD repeat protein